MSKVEISQDDNGCTNIHIDGVKLKRVLRAEYSQCVGEVPGFIFETIGEPNIVTNNCDIQFSYHPETLQQASTIIQSEFAKKSDWYDALVASVSSALKELPEDVILCDVAERIADRLIGE